jgi:3-hydroxyisobutyrate dehydrogenase-like beta-hydroxyacid dehydrogenase
MARIAILHPGEMGAALGAALVGAGHDVGWLPERRSANTHARAHDAGLTPLLSLDDRAYVLSVCPPGAALETVRALGRFTGCYVDANAISPDTARTVAAVAGSHGARYVDGGIVGPPPLRGESTRLYLSGPGAGEVADLFADTSVRTTVIDTGEFAASAMKMAYASWSKVSQALVLAVDGAAAALGVQGLLHEAWADTEPDALARLDRARAAAVAKGWRWEAEMREIALTFAAAGQPPGFGEAAAAEFGHHSRPT